MITPKIFEGKMIKQSFKYKRKHYDENDLYHVKQNLIEQLKIENFEVEVNNNQIDFKVKPRYTSSISKNRRIVIRILRNGKINLYIDPKYVFIVCKYELKHLIILSLVFALIVPFYIYSNYSFSISLLAFIIVSGLSLAIGMILNYFRIRYIIKM